MGSREEEGNGFMEGQGVDGHVGDDFLCFFVFIFFHDGSNVVDKQLREAKT